MPLPRPISSMTTIILTFMATPSPATVISPKRDMMLFVMIFEALMRMLFKEAGTPMASTPAAIPSFAV